MLPNAIYVGMGKSGSTLLHKLFLRHPDIYVAEDGKEINFFSKYRNWVNGVAWYESHFAGYGGEQWVVDISPGYHSNKMSIERMREVFGGRLKIIFTFRRFTEYAYSKYLHRIRGRAISGSFMEMLEQKAMFYKPLDELVGDYVDAFGRENVLIMQYEKEFNRRAPSFESAIYEFLGLADASAYYEKNADIGVNAGYCPRFVYAENEPYEEEYDGVHYRVPKNTLVFCSGRRYRNAYWAKNARSKAREALELQRGWTTCLDEDAFNHVQKAYTEPLAERLEERLGISFAHWYADKAKRIEYRKAPLPDAYIADPVLLAERLEANRAIKPWS